MTIFRTFLVCSFLGLSFSAASQTNESPVFLKWKLKPGEVLTYKTLMNEVDTPNHKDLSMEGMMRSIGIKDTSDQAQMKKIMAQLSKSVEKLDLVTNLSEKRKGIVDIVMSAVDTSKEELTMNGKNVDDSLRNIGRLLNKFSGGVTLRAAIYEDGSLQSFYIPNGQRNIVNMFFQLPAKPIKPGDSWSLDTYLVSFDQNFQCDTSFRTNKVTFTKLEVVNNEHIANVEYDIMEYAGGNFSTPFNNETIKTMMRMTFKASAKFSIEKGRWVSYDGLMSLSSSGIMSAQSTKRFSLIPQ